MNSAPKEEEATATGIAGSDHELLDKTILHDPIGKAVGESVAPPSLPENLGEALGEQLEDVKVTLMPQFSPDADTARGAPSQKFLDTLGEKMQKSHPGEEVNLN